MNAYVARKLAEFAASILILVPCVLLLAWETALPNATFLWAVLLACSGVFLAALMLCLSSCFYHACSRFRSRSRKPSAPILAAHDT